MLAAEREAARRAGCIPRQAFRRRRSLHSRDLFTRLCLDSGSALSTETSAFIACNRTLKSSIEQDPCAEVLWSCIEWHQNLHTRAAEAKTPLTRRGH
jgi:hypothetical protein